MVNISITARPVDSIDAPSVIDFSAGVPLPGSGSAPMQIVASLAENVHALQVKDGVQTAYVDVMKGPAGQETWVATICGPGEALQSVYLPKGTRVSIRRADDPTAISSGTLAINFMGS